MNALSRTDRPYEIWNLIFATDVLGFFLYPSIKGIRFKVLFLRSCEGLITSDVKAKAAPSPQLFQDP